MNDTFFVDDHKTDSERIIHTPSSFARNNLTYAQETGTLKSLKQHVCTRENLESYLFFIVKEGQGTVYTGGKDYPVHKGDMVFLDCRRLYSHASSEENPWEIRWVHFNGNKVKALFSLFEEANVKSPVIKASDDKQSYTDLLDRLEKELNNNTVMAEISQSLILDELATLCLKAVTGNKKFSVDENDLKTDDFATLRESVNDHIGEPDLQRILAIQYGLPGDKLSEMFTTKYGISLSDYILNRQLNKAKELLRFTIKPIAEIVNESGINDEALFRKLFMESEEMSPEDYRKRWAQWIKS